MKNGRSPCGERGLKSPDGHGDGRRGHGRSPCGERGLKFHSHYLFLSGGLSLPVRGAWVEIMRNMEQESGKAVAPRAGSVG